MNTDYILRLRRGMEDSEFNYMLCSEKPFELRTKAFVRDLKKFVKYQFIKIFATVPERKVFANYILISSKYGMRMYFPHMFSILKAKVLKK